MIRLWRLDPQENHRGIQSEKSSTPANEDGRKGFIWALSPSRPGVEARLAFFVEGPCALGQVPGLDA